MRIIPLCKIFECSRYAGERPIIRYLLNPNSQNWESSFEKTTKIPKYGSNIPPTDFSKAVDSRIKERDKGIKQAHKRVCALFIDTLYCISVE